MKIAKLLILLKICVTLSGCASLAQGGAMIEVYEAMHLKDYDEAIIVLSEAESYKKPSAALKAEIAFLRGQCYEYRNNKEEAIGQYKYIVTNHPDSEYAYKALEKVRLFGENVDALQDHLSDELYKKVLYVNENEPLQRSKSLIYDNAMPLEPATIYTLNMKEDFIQVVDSFELESGKTLKVHSFYSITPNVALHGMMFVDIDIIEDGSVVYSLKTLENKRLFLKYVFQNAECVDVLLDTNISTFDNDNTEKLTLRSKQGNLFNVNVEWKNNFINRISFLPDKYPEIKKLKNETNDKKTSDKSLIETYNNSLHQTLLGQGR